MQRTAIPRFAVADSLVRVVHLVENQIITAEEKRGILKLQAEEKNKYEALVRENLKSLMEEKLAQSAAGGARKG